MPATTTRTDHAVEAAPVLDLEARMAVVAVEMTGRLDEAALGFEVNAAHLATTPPDLDDVVRLPVAAPLPPLVPYPTPVAALLQRAARRMEARGWCAGQFVDLEGAKCSWGAIRAEAGGDAGLEDRAVAILLEAIRRRFNASSVPEWNDAQRDGQLPVRMLGDAAVLADARGL